MDDFHLGDRIIWTTTCRTGIIIDLLDYEGKRLGLIGVVLDNPKEFKSLNASECKRFEPPYNEEEDWRAPYTGWLGESSGIGNDVY